MFMFGPLRYFAKALILETTPRQLALGFALGMVIGLVPKGNLIAVRALDSIAIRKNAVSEAEIDRLQLASDKADLEILQAAHDQKTAGLTSRLKETEMKLARQALERRTIASPLSGMVVQVMQQQGEWVTGGKTVFRVVRLDRLRVEGFVSAKRSKADLVGRKVTWTVDLGDDPATDFAGEIVFVSPEVDPVNQTVRVWAEIENSKLVLRPGLRGKVKIH